jgi:hypothetical protein
MPKGREKAEDNGEIPAKLPKTRGFLMNLLACDRDTTLRPKRPSALTEQGPENFGINFSDYVIWVGHKMR